jgi:Ca2+-transporting ATPase
VSIYDREKLPPNRYLTLALGGSIAIQILTFLIPGLRGLLGLSPINLLDGIVIGGSAVLPLLVNEAVKGSSTGTSSKGTVKPHEE